MPPRWRVMRVRAGRRTGREVGSGNGTLHYDAYSYCLDAPAPLRRRLSRRAPSCSNGSSPVRAGPSQATRGVSETLRRPNPRTSRRRPPPPFHWRLLKSLACRQPKPSRSPACRRPPPRRSPACRRPPPRAENAAPKQKKTLQIPRLPPAAAPGGERRPKAKKNRPR